MGGDWDKKLRHVSFAGTEEMESLEVTTVCHVVEAPQVVGGGRWFGGLSRTLCDVQKGRGFS